MGKKTKELAIDDKDLRKINTQKVVKCVESITDYVEEGKKTAKTTKVYLLVMLGVVLFIILGGIITIYFKSDGLDGFANNLFVMENAKVQIVCTNGEYNMTFITNGASINGLRQALDFRELFNNSKCWIEER